MDARTQFQEKLKYYSALEKKVRRLLLKEENEEAIKTLVQIIQGYKSIGVVEKARLLETELQNFATAFNINLQEFSESSVPVEESEKASETTGDSGRILGFIESLEKKVKRRILQGKTQEAITDLKYVISELRNLRNFEKAELLEDTLNQFIADLSAPPGSSISSAPPTQAASAAPDYPSPSDTQPPIENSNIQPFIPLTSDRPPVPAPPVLTRPSIPPAQPPVNFNPDRAPNIADLLPGARPKAPSQMSPQAPMAPFTQSPMAFPVQTPQSSVARPAQEKSPIAFPPSPPSVAITPPLQPPSSPVPPAASPPETIKDQPFSEEELLLKKLFEIKNMLGKK